jgi:NADH-quinone oxidoreductase subunit A
MYFDYFNVLVFSAVGLVFVFANLIVASVLRPKRTVTEGLETYECGEETIGDAWIQFDIRYYTVALVYIVFAVEIAFLFPWAIVLHDAPTAAAQQAGWGAMALVEGFTFITILFLGLAYVWAKGDLDWVLAWTGNEYQPPDKASGVHVPTVKDLEQELEDQAAAEHLEEGGDEEAA